MLILSLEAVIKTVNLKNRGYVVVFEAPTAGGGRVAFHEGGVEAPGLIELIESIMPLRRRPPAASSRS
jgi:hypothetical protein